MTYTTDEATADVAATVDDSARRGVIEMTSLALGRVSDLVRRTAPRDLFRLDAAISGANGAAYLIAARPLGELLGLSPALLRVLGIVLVAFAAAAWLVATRPVARATAVAFAFVNAAWAIASIVVAIAGWGSPSTIGTLWIVAQAVVVAAFAELQAASRSR